uniref:PPPDE domain-containing protein n=1 Tax=Salix viminalis TaxID=40686 RepID=A0A6N2LGZ3_SALVM
MTEVILHVYDVTNSGSEKTNNTILNINKIFKDAIGLGGIFHSAVQIHGDDEWSFGFCEQGTGVFSCPSTKNPMYTYRERIVLGKTSFSISKVNQILRELSREWPGNAYDLLAKNCNHFCDEFCVRLGVSKLPGWVNRFANAGDAAMEVAGTTAFRFRQAKTEIVSASKVAYRFLASVTSNNGSALESPENSNRGVPRFQGTWFKNLIANGVKPSSSTEVDNQRNMLLQHQRSTQGAGQPSRQISQQESDKQGAGQLSRQISQQESDLPPLHQNSRHDEALPASSTF